MLAMAALATVPPASAAEMTWHVFNDSPFNVDLQFHARARGVVWPPSGRVFYVLPRRTTPARLTCQAGELVCYGAWIRGNRSRFWGVGPDDRYGCRGCCFVCRHGATIRVRIHP
jgi:hypothetical protein